MHYWSFDGHIRDAVGTNHAEADGNTKMAEKLNALKETLVITTGDNYVGAADPQLREKMAKLYGKVADSYDKPSSADLDNLKIITERFDKAKADSMSLKSYEEFLESK